MVFSTVTGAARRRAWFGLISLILLFGCSQSTTPLASPGGLSATPSSTAPPPPIVSSAAVPSNAQPPARATGAAEQPAESSRSTNSASIRESPTIADDSSKSPSELADASDRFAVGRKVFESNGCARCHSIGGTGGPVGAGAPLAGGPRPGGMPGSQPGVGAMSGRQPGSGQGGGGGGGGGGGFGGGGMMGRARGPDLAKVGANPQHTVEWLMEHVRNPKTHKPDSRMPPFAGKINEQDLKALAEYLASLK